MITVTVSKKNNSYVSFTSKGHAGYAEEGYDIICAAVSALDNQHGEFPGTADEEIRLRQRRVTDSYLSLSLKPVSEEGTLLMDSLVLGLTEIENSYSKRYLKVKVREV